MIVYDRLWRTMQEKGISQYRLIKYYGFSSGQIGRLKKNSYVSTHTIDVLCAILNCQVEDIMEFRQDISPERSSGTSQSEVHQSNSLLTRLPGQDEQENLAGLSANTDLSKLTDGID